MNNNLIDKLAAIGVVVLITMCILHPSIWFGAIGTIVHLLLVLLVAKIVCRVVFKKSIKELIFDRDDD